MRLFQSVASKKGEILDKKETFYQVVILKSPNKRNQSQKGKENLGSPNNQNSQKSDSKESPK